MIELYEMPNYPAPFPRRFLGDYLDLVEMQDKYFFTDAEMQTGLNGDVVQDQFIFEFSPKFLHELAVDQALQSKHMDALDRDEICEVLGISQQNLTGYLSSFKRKLIAAGKEAQFILAVQKIGEIKRKKTGPPR